jgi:hypothetical protein
VIDPIAYAADGATIVCGDGPELLVFRGDGAPDYKLFTDGVIVGVAVLLDRLLVAHDDGTISWRSRRTGEVLDEVQLGEASREMIVSVDGAVAVRVDGGVWIVRPSQAPRRVAWPALSAMSWGPDGNSLGLGAETGRFAAVDPHQGVPWGEVDLGAPVRSIAWSRGGAGSWVVSAGDRLCVVQGDGRELLRHRSGLGPLGPVAVSVDGLLAAVISGRVVHVTELDGFRGCGELTFRRLLSDVTFGPNYWLAIGLDDGDITLSELLQAAVRRTEPHPGRARNVWAMDATIDRDIIRGASARHRAGGAPIAKWVRPKEEEQAAASEGSGCWRSALLVGCFTVLGLIVCSGMMGGLWYAQQGWLSG